MKIFRNMIISAMVLATFAGTGTFFIAYTYENTLDRINENKRIALLNAFHVLIKPEQHDNDMFTDYISVTNKELLGSNKAVNIYRARKQGKPVAVIINSVAPDGYSGNIDLLVAIYNNGTLAGVRVIQHKETPGLGDAIDTSRSNWILGFNQQSLTNTSKQQWAVKKDGGKFDQLTGATISPRAIVKAVYNTLLFYKKNKNSLFLKIKKTDKS